MSKEELIKALHERAKEEDGRKKLTCAKAFEIAKQAGAEVIEVGWICNQQNIKICKCQLGCFK